MSTLKTSHKISFHSETWIHKGVDFRHAFDVMTHTELDATQYKNHFKVINMSANPVFQNYKLVAFRNVTCGGNFTSRLQKVASKFFRLIKPLTHKPKKDLSAN